MPSKIFAKRSSDDLPRRVLEGSAEPDLAPRSAPRTRDAVAVSSVLSEMSSRLSDAGNEQLFHGRVSGASLPAGRRTAAARRPAGILLYLAFVALVATATIGVFFGIGFFLLAQPTEEMSAGFGRHDRGAETSPQRSEAVPRPNGEAASVPGGTEKLRTAAEASSQSDVAAIPQRDIAVKFGGTFPETAIVVAEWGVGYSLETARNQVRQGNVVHGRRLYLLMTLNGTQAAVDRMRVGPRLAIEVRWERENGTAPAGTSNRVTDLPIGRPGLADALEQQVRRRGFFEWHTWATRDVLSPGTWTVSLTYPNGQRLLCGQDAQPCRLIINVD